MPDIMYVFDVAAPPERDSNVPGWTGTQIGFDLQSDGHDTTFRFSHRGFARHDDAYARTTWGWGTYFRSLELYLITGKGTPHGDR